VITVTNAKERAGVHSSLVPRSPRRSRIRRLFAGGLALAVGVGLAAGVTTSAYADEPAPSVERRAAAGTVYEAEDQTLTGVTRQTEHSGFTGTGFVGGFGNTGNSVRATIPADTAGAHDLFVRYANGNGSNRTLNLTVNGTPRQITLPSHGQWNTWGFVHAPIDLVAGSNTVELSKTATDSGQLNIDHLRVAPVVGTRYEAESGVFTGSARRASDHAGYTGTGFVGGVQSVGAGSTLTVNATQAGNHPATLRYANGPNPFEGTKTVTVDVNGTTQQVRLPGRMSWKDWDDVSLDLPLVAGPNQVAVRFGDGDTGNVNLDHLDVGPPAPPTCAPAVDPDDDFSGSALDRCRWAAVLNEDTTAYRVANGALQVDAKSGDLAGGITNAKNVVLQHAPTGNWMSETALSVDGSDDYLQAGLVVWGSSANFGKVTVIRTPTEGWKVELGRVTNRQLAHIDSGTLPGGAQTDIRLRLWTIAEVLRASYSLDDGATWTVVDGSLPVAGISTPLLGVAAFNGTGAETARFDSFAVGSPVLASPTVTVQSAPSTVEPGQPSVVTVNVTATGTDPSGEVTLRDGDEVVGTKALVDGSATFNVGPYDTTGTRSLTATYAGDTAVAPGSGTGTLTVASDPEPVASTVTVSAAPASVQTGQTSTVTVTVAADGTTPTGDVVLTDNGTQVGNPVALANGTATFTVGPYTAAGTRDLAATYAGSATVTGSTGSGSLTVTPAPVASSVTVSAAPASVQTGQTSTVTVRVTATGTTPTGTVVLTDNGTQVGTPVALSNGTATFTVGPYTAAGTRQLSATYAGSATVTGSTGSGSLTVTPAPVASTVTVSAAPASVQTGQTSTVTVRVTATGTTPTGTVVLRDNGTQVGNPVALSNGTATFTVGPYAAAGTRTLTASYAGSATVTSGNGSGSLAVTQAPVASTVTVSAAPASVQTGQTSTVTVRVTATGTTPTGDVVLRDNGTQVGTATSLADGTATFTVGPYAAAGTRTLTASYAGSATVTAGNGSGSLTVTAPDPEPVAATVTVAANPGTVLTGQGATVVVTVAADGATPTGTVALTDDGTPVGDPVELHDGTATFTVGPYAAAGTRELVATYAGSATVAAGTGTGSLVVTAPEPEPLAATVSVTADPGAVLVGGRTDVTVEVTADGATPTGRVVLSDGVEREWVGTLVDGTVVFRVGPWSAAGTRTLTATYAGDDVVAAGTGTTTVTVRPQPRPVVRVATKVVDATANRRHGVVEVTCAPVGVRCVGTVRLVAGGKVLGTAKLAVAGGRTATLRVALNARARKALAKRPRTAAQLVVTMPGSRSTFGVTLRR
jgi:hypothetical protein